MFAPLRIYARAWYEAHIVCKSEQVLALVFFGCNYAANATGLGRPIDTLSSRQGTIERLNVLTLVSNLSWITALSLSKSAIVLMLLRTTPTASHKRLQYLVGALVLMQCVLSITLMTAGCSVFEGFAWSFRSNVNTCSRQSLRWQVITGLDIATELAVLALPLQLVWNLQMSIKNKFVVIVAFWLRIPTLVFTILRDNATNNLSYTSDVSLTAAMVVVWQTIELSYSIAAATVAALKRFTESLNTGFGHGELIRVRKYSEGYKMSDRSASLKGSGVSKPSIKAEQIPNHANEHNFQGVPLESKELQRLKLRPEGLHNKVTISTLPRHSDSGKRPNDIHYDEDPLMPEQHCRQ
ncbi:hypothetical protein ST47_g9361 [Ascochyta rabiei]|uniref:Rhodopsin domain-containing protein n=1 Tax=Didymella rabiei TaxID=5454 RepID=A0A162X9K6_DIDRA|nr:hypothetical protein ST47_g9361 [Ascochyta rabiei]